MKKSLKYLILCVSCGILFLSIVAFNMIRISLDLVEGVQDIWFMEFLIPLFFVWMVSFALMDNNLKREKGFP